MSQTADTATATSPPLSPARSADAALSFFEEAIWHNPDVCSNCFSRVKRRYRAVEESTGGKEIAVDDSWRTRKATLGESSSFVRHRGCVTVRNVDNAVVGVTSREPVRGSVRYTPRTTCLECGSVRAIKQTDTVSKARALELAPVLVERLRELGNEVDASVVSDVVYHLKSDDTHEAFDKEIFATAAALGVDKA